MATFSPLSLSVAELSSKVREKSIHAEVGRADAIMEWGRRVGVETRSYEQQRANVALDVVLDRKESV